MSSKEFLRHIVSDVVTGMTEGVMGMDPHVQQNLMIIGLTGIMADYPAVSSALYFKGHTADDPCHL